MAAQTMRPPQSQVAEADRLHFMCCLLHLFYGHDCAALPPAKRESATHSYRKPSGDRGQSDQAGQPAPPRY
ncbi:MAG: hypothetical protein ACFNS5_11055 [Prevotella melaninogenica]